MVSMKLPLWLRFFLLLGALGLATGASLLAYRYYTHPVTLSVAVGSIDGEAARAMSAIASRLVTTNAPVRLKVVDSGTALEAAKAFAAGKVDLAVVRGDVGDLSQAQAVVVVSYMVVLIIAPPGSSIDSIDKLKGRRVGVIGGDANVKIIDVLSKEFGLDRAKVFKEIALPDVRAAIQSKEVSALLVVIPLAEKYLSLVKGFVAQGPKALPVLIPIDSAGAIAQAERAYESFDVPKGTLRGAPPVPIHCLWRGSRNSAETLPPLRTSAGCSTRRACRSWPSCRWRDRCRRQSTWWCPSRRRRESDSAR